MIHQNILQAMGNTPMVAINRLNPNPAVKILAKVESGNPGGSIKDRVALAMIEAAEASGELTPDKTVIEATSGNTGVGLAMVCAVKGYKLTLLMPETASVERRMIMQAYGADIRLTPGHLSTDGAIELAYRLAREEPDRYVLMDQFNNPASTEAHYRSTGQEIWDQTDGQVTHVVISLGTSGTVMGVTKRLKELNPDIVMAAMEPFAGHKIQGLKNMQESYPPGIYDKTAIDRFIRVEDEEAFETCRLLAREEGIFAGMSSGAAMAAAMKWAREIESGTIVTILPDGGERYLSTPLFAPRDAQGPALFNAAQNKEIRLPADGGPGGKAGLFTMGPGPDAPGELGAWRRIVFLDVLARHLNVRGVDARVAVGVADMDDRGLAALKAARAAGSSDEDYYGTLFGTLADLGRRIGISDACGFFRAGESVDTALDVCRKLLGKGAAYEKLRSVYFDVLRFARYGAMALTDMDKLSHGKTVDLENYVKDNPMDFTLLKRATLADLKTADCLQTEWGNVRPTWFLQHAAVAMDKLDNVSVFMAEHARRFPHLENFRALLSLGRNIEPAAWMLCQDVCALTHGEGGAACQPEQLGGRPVPGLDEILARPDIPARAVRMWLLSTSYHKPLSYSEDNLAMWRKNWSRVQHMAGLLRDVQESDGTGRVGARMEQAVADLRAGLRDALDNDLSLHRFWPALFQFCRETGDLHARGLLTGPDAAEASNQLDDVDKRLGVLDRSALPVPRLHWPAEAADLALRRMDARGARDFALADALRDELLAAGYRVEDTAEGPRLYPA